MKIPFFIPDITDAECRGVTDVLRSTWISPGRKVEELEAMTASFCGADNAVCLNSCTAALEMALRMLGIGQGDEVIVPAYTFSATAAAVINAGARPVMVDSVPDGVLIDPHAIAEAVTEHTKAVIPVDIGGVPCDYDEIASVCREMSHIFHPFSPLQEHFGRIAVIADSAHGLGGKRGDRMCGTLADITCFSFHSVKNVTTGDGGAIVWNNFQGWQGHDLDRYVRMMACHGQTRNAFAKNGCADMDYDIEEIGCKCNMNDFTASLGISQLRRYGESLRRRREIIRMYDGMLSGLPLTPIVHSNVGFESSAHLYMILLDPDMAYCRGRIISELAERGVQCNIHYKPLPMMTAYRRLGYDMSLYPNAYDSYLREITLPLYPSMSDDEVEYVARGLKDVIESIEYVTEPLAADEGL